MERGLDPLTTNLVVADESRTDKTICLAVSPTLKAYGISGRARLFEVKQRLEAVKRKTGKEVNFIIAMPRMQLYLDVSAKIYGIYLKYISPEDIWAYSVDEVFIDAFEGGHPVPHPHEAEIVREIFSRYCSRESLKNIAEGLTSRRIEYSPGKTAWDKARIKRILENSRYIGDGDYPAIIEKEQFVTANLIKETANTNKLTIDEDTKLFKEMTVCAKCGGKVTRRIDSRFAEPVSWKCAECGWSIRLSDQQFKEQIITAMNGLITVPNLVYPDDEPQEVYSLESKRLLNEFHRALDSGKSSEDELIKMVMQIGSANYQAINSQEAISARLAADFGKAELRPTFQRELFQRTVRRIQLTQSGEITLELQNNHIITERKE